MGLGSATILLLLIAATSHSFSLEKVNDDVDQSNRIVGGETAPSGFAPYQVSLQNLASSSHICGGAILNDKWIITAAHCVEGWSLKQIAVVIGTNNWEKPGATHSVEKIYQHCSWNSPFYSNDIALVRVISPIIFNDRTQPIALPTQQMKDGADVILTGWGLLEDWGSPVKNLQKLNLKYIPYETCLKIVNYPEFMHVGQICAFTRKGQGACYGDSGGPLVSDGHLVGLVSWGEPCGTGVPDVYASVYYYREWIQQIMMGKTICIK